MTLKDFKSKFLGMPGNIDPPMLYIFECEESAENWISLKYKGEDDHGFILVGVVQSDMTADYTLKDEWVNAEVQQFYALESDKIAIVVEVKRDV